MCFFIIKYVVAFVYFYGDLNLIFVVKFVHSQQCLSFCRFWFFKIIIIIVVIIGAFFIKDPTFDEGKFIIVKLICTMQQK